MEMQNSDDLSFTLNPLNADDDIDFVVYKVNGDEKSCDLEQGGAWQPVSFLSNVIQIIIVVAPPV
ncbi:MAG: hypothetical protein IPN87_16115 [Saprospiraceae bacterium]|nr:hypothetical protein [Candidatus Brachybacter algidus]